MGRKGKLPIKSEKMPEQKQAPKLETNMGSPHIKEEEVTDPTFTECLNDDMKQFQCKDCSYASAEDYDIAQHVNSCHSDD